MTSARKALLTLLALPVMGACAELEEFTATGDELYQGEVIGSDEGVCSPGDVCSFIRRGFSEGTVLDMQLDPTQASSDPGTITTRDEVCGPTFTDEPLLPIPALFHDQLSLYDFPGEPRIQSYIFALRPTTGPLAGRDAMAFVSLVRGGEVEVRVIAGQGMSDCSADADCTRYLAGECDYFGVFRLKRTTR